MNVFSSEKIFSHNGVTTRYFIFGKGPQLFFLHGLGATPLTYRSFLEPLSQYFTIIAPQIPPFGGSNVPPSSWRVASYADYFSAFLEQHHVGQVIAVGHSYGGAITLELAAVNPHIQEVFVCNPMGIACLTTWKEIISKVLFGSIFGYCVGKETLRLPLVGDFIFSFLRHFFHIPEMITIIRHVCSETDIPFSRIAKPVTILWGKQEELFYQSYLFDLQNKIPHATTHEIDGYHNWIFFHQKKAIELIVEVTQIGKL